MQTAPYNMILKDLQRQITNIGKEKTDFYMRQSLLYTTVLNLFHLNKS